MIKKKKKAKNMENPILLVISDSLVGRSSLPVSHLRLNPHLHLFLYHNNLFIRNHSQKIILLG